jgi:nucleoside-diphosphate-sugar epimerase
VDALEELLSRPTDAAVAALGRLDGDVLVLGAGGKMGPTLARMAVRASEAAGVRRRVIGAARFTDPRAREALERAGVETVRCDLLNPAELAALPDAPNVVYMPAMKFGATGNEPLTWAMNTFLAGECARRFRASRVVAFSTGNVYGLTPVACGGSRESDSLRPAGEYAMSCLGRERLFEHFSRANGTRCALVRLNYAAELRYGVLADLARRVWAGEPVDLAMGHVNVVWQGDANAAALAAFGHAASPPFVVNVAGPETLAVRAVCERFGALFGKPPRFAGAEAADALLSNGQPGHRLFGYPRVPVDRLIVWVAEWVRAGGPDLGRPTKFDRRDGTF